MKLLYSAILFCWVAGIFAPWICPDIPQLREMLWAVPAGWCGGIMIGELIFT